MSSDTTAPVADGMAWTTPSLWRRAILWHHLRPIGNSTTAKLTILIPIIGYLIIFNDYLQIYIRLSPPLDVRNALAAVEPRLLFIYFGLCFIALGSCLFTTCCPPQVKKYASPEEYIAGEESSLSERGVILVEQALANGDKITKRWVRELEEWYERRPSAQSLEEVRRRGANLFRYKMHIYYELLDRKRVAFRWITTLAYIIGFVALMIPALRIFVRVSAILYHTVVTGLP
jgi:hypothetical protein